MAKQADKTKEKTSYESAQNKLKQMKTEAIVLNAVIIVLGLIMICMSRQFNEYIAQIIGGGLCIWGILRCFSFLRLKSEDMVGSYALVQGAAMIGFGLFFLYRPEEAKLLLNHLLGMAIIITAVMKIQDAINYLKLKIKNWWFHLICAAALIAFAVVAIIRPQFAEDESTQGSIIIILIGVAFVLSGIWDLITIHIMSKIIKQTAKALEALPTDTGKKDKKDKPQKEKKEKVNKNAETTHFSDPELDAIDKMDYGDDN